MRMHCRFGSSALVPLLFLHGFALSGCGESSSELGEMVDGALGGAPGGGSGGGGGGATGFSAAPNGGAIGSSGGIVGAGGMMTGGFGPIGAGGVASGGTIGSSGGDLGSGGMIPSNGGSGSGGDLGTGGAPDTGGNPGTGGDIGTGGSTGSCDAPPPPSPLVGWASVQDGSTKTIGGEGGPTTTVTTLSELTAAVKGTNPQIIQLKGTIDGDITIGSNKTLVGICGATLRGRISMNRSVNVIVRNLKIVGDNCTDSPSDCQDGTDVVSVQGAAHHLWFDHDDISDGSDGNLDITHASDFITISWTKFHYSGKRAGGHQFSNLIGHDDDNAAEDTGHLRITFHHTWWADNAVERMPRVRFGRVHLFNNLWTSAGNNYCIGVGNSSNIRSENNVFVGVDNPIKDYATDGSGLIRSFDNDYSRASGTKDDIGSGTVFTPSYSVTLDPTSAVEAAVRSGAGPH